VKQPTGIQQRAILAAMVGLLASCSSLPSPTPAIKPDGAFAYAITINLHSGDTRESLEQRYNGQVKVWNDQGGYAILGSDVAPTSDPAVRGVDNNTNAYSTPETQLAARAPELTPEAMNSGSWSAWSGGWNAWSGGTGTSLSPNENKPIWAKIGLNPHTLSRAPQLGAGIKIAVVDTGIDLNHPAFTDCLVPSTEQFDFVDNDTVPQEAGTAGVDAAFGHGTGVAGVIAQVAPNARIMPLRVLRPNGSGDETAVAAAIDWARTRGANIIHMSLGGTTDSTALSTAINSAVNAGILVVASVGNDNLFGAQYPARYADAHTMAGSMTCFSCPNLVIGVASVNNNDKKSSYSNYGTGTSMTAPGEYVYTPFPSNRLAYWSGTSFAAPMVTGAIALAFGQNLSLSASQTATNVELGDRIDITNLSFAGQLGSGRLNIAKFFGRIGL
jgi:subtilisin family serine protease